MQHHAQQAIEHCVQEEEEAEDEEEEEDMTQRTRMQEDSCGDQDGLSCVLGANAYWDQGKRQLHALQHIDPFIQAVQLGVLVSAGKRHQQRRRYGR